MNLEEGIVVLSLFDGQSCGLQALKQAGVKVKRYFASEIDPYAMAIAKKNHPEITHIGSVVDVLYRNGTLYWIEESGKIRFAEIEIDLVIGGSPCQGFSFAGKQLNFSDARSKLFFEYTRLVEETDPNYFFLENVVMKKEFQAVITRMMGVEPIMINSALVSAQSRKRLYWTNIKGVEQPEDRGILLIDILQPEEEINPSLYLNKVAEDYMFRSSEKWSGGKQRMTTYENHHDAKAHCLTANMYKGIPYGVTQAGRIVGRRKNEEGKREDDNKGIKIQQYYEMKYRRLTCIECERLQGLPDNYTAFVSNTQRYKMLGNGWQVDTIEHIFKLLHIQDIL